MARGYKDSGVLSMKVTITDCYTFLDYIIGGTEINLMISVDFTGSNGKPTDPNSLHAIKNGQLNGIYSFQFPAYNARVRAGND